MHSEGDYNVKYNSYLVSRISYLVSRISLTTQEKPTMH